MKLVSILLPTYNVESYIEEAVHSILQQSWKYFELIVVDDCSTDKTYEIVYNLSKIDSRIKLYRNEKNLKICTTLNRALSYAKGEYIARMDGDDISENDRIEKLINYLDEHPDCSLVGSQVKSIDESGKFIAYKRLLCSSNAIYKYMPVMPCVLHIWLARREMYDTLGGYREIPYAEDYDFLLRGMNKGFKYANVNECLYSVRLRDGNTISTNGLIQRKTKEYVSMLYKLEKNGKDVCFDKHMYSKRIECSNNELKKYRYALRRLNYAITHRNQKVVMVINTIIAMMSSKYISKHVFETLIIRLAIFKEDRNFNINIG